jgi:hypothetical protein
LDIFAWEPPISPLKRCAALTKGKPLYNGAVLATFKFPPGPMPRVYATRGMSLDLAFGDPSDERPQFADTVALVRRLVDDVAVLI